MTSRKVGHDNPPKGHPVDILLFSASVVASVLARYARQFAAVRGTQRLHGSGGRASVAPFNKDDVLSRRRKYFCEAQSVSYDNSDPLYALQGDGQFLIDEQGNRFLDTRNNVAHVGWQNARVNAAVKRQIDCINCNTRYIHHLRGLLAERLLDKLPDNLTKVFFVNSGSEANDLALRLARAHTGSADLVVVEHGYHGNTIACLEASHYKYAHARGRGKAKHVHQVAAPERIWLDGSTTEDEAAAKYAGFVRMACEEARTRTSTSGVSAFIVESAMSVAGAIVPPKGYLRQAFDFVHAAGGVCIADEVQVGFGRVGPAFWGFALGGDDVRPDIVTMGKPFGNGFPLGAVATTAAIAESFARNTPEYFNTFGGNPVACAAGLAVLNEIQERDLASHAMDVGEHLKRALRLLAQNSLGADTVIQDVRGSGLFLGVEIGDGSSHRPGTGAARTSVLCSRLKDKHRILTTIDGPYHNVLVVKPPLTFTKQDADFLVRCIREELPLITQSDVDNYSHTST